MSTNLHPDNARGMIVPNKKQKTETEAVAERSRDGKERVEHDSPTGKEVLERAAERNDPGARKND